jgi:hypothetical protein
MTEHYGPKVVYTYHDVIVGLTAVQAEWLRGVIDEAANAATEELHRTRSAGAANETEETIALAEVVLEKFDRAIADGIRQRVTGSRGAE